MGNPVFVAVPSAADFPAFLALCAPSFAREGYEAFRSWVDSQNEARQKRRVRTIEVPLNIDDLRQWLGGRRLNEVLWLAYAATRAWQADPVWPPVTRPSNIGGESDFIDVDAPPTGG